MFLVVLLAAFLASSLPTFSSSFPAPLGAYVHIPFCTRRCHYCDFPIVAIGNKAQYQREISQDYVAILKKEIQFFSKAFPGQLSKLETLYFGGGTPSILPIDCLDDIIQSISDQIGFAKFPEITIEIDPGTFDSFKLNEYFRLGISRLSVGVQSFDDRILQICGRQHTRQEIFNALTHISNSKIDNFNIDLISGLPRLSLKKWIETLEEGANTGCSHISIYDLQIEENSAFGKWFSPGRFPLPSERSAVAMFKAAVKLLTAHGFEHYEISNYAKSQKRSKHNQKYWRSEPFWGFGMGAGSYVEGVRFVRPRTFEGYKNWVSQLDQCDSLHDAFNNATKKTELKYTSRYESRDGLNFFDFIMLALRTSDGIDLRVVEQKFGSLAKEQLLRVVQEHVAKKYLRLDGKKKSDISRIALADPKGFLVSNTVISSIISGLYK